MLFAAPLARRGFQVFIQSTRGTFGSGGQFRPFITEREDGLATVAWLRDQPWCDGQVAMTGASYLGHTQWAVAPYADPPLRSVSPATSPAAKITAAFYHHGVPSLQNALNWTGLIGRQERGLLGAAAEPAAAGPDAAGAAEGPAAGRRRRRGRRAGRVLAGLHRPRRPGRRVLGGRRPRPAPT